MRIDRLRAHHFRNLEELQLALGGGLTVFHGANGQGKTNLLEALYYLANLKSFRGARRGELIRFEQPTAVLEAEVARGELRRHFRVELDRQRRVLSVDGKDPRSLSGYFQGIRAVAFTPGDPAMIRGAPTARRAFLDRGVFLQRPDHLDLVREVGRMLAQRNALLRSVPRDRGGAQLEVYNQQLVAAGAELSARRAALVEDLGEPLAERHRQLAEGRGTLTIQLRSDTPPGDPAALAARLAERADAEWERRQSLSGPQRDDLVVELDGHPLRTFGSQGQVRTAALALKLALMALVTRVAGDPPVFLLDDLGSELDPERNRRLLDALLAEGGQVFVATTSLSHVPLPRDRYAAHEVVAGEVRTSASTG